jgi:lipoprotein-releasing system permease protein
MYRIFLGFRWLASRPIGIVTMIGIWLSVAATTVTVAVMTGFLRDHERLARGATADLVVTPKLERAADGTIAPPPAFEQWRAALQAVPGLEAVSPRLLRPALIRIEGIEGNVVMGDRRFVDRNSVRVFGVDPDIGGGAANFKRHLDVPPPRPDPYRVRLRESDLEVDDPERPFRIDPKHLPARIRNARLPVALVGSEMLEYFDLRKGQLIVLTTIPDDLESGQPLKPLSEKFVIGGAVHTGNREVDGSAIYLALERARSFTRARGDLTEVCIELAPDVDLAATAAGVVAALDRAGIKAKVETWRERGRRLLDAVANERSIIGVLLFFFLVVACFNIFSTLTILVTDKTRDIGVLAALGARPGGIRSIFLFNGLLMALIGAGLGVHYGLKLTESLNPINDWSATTFGLSLFPRDVFVFTAIPYVFVPEIVVGTFVATLALALLCAWVPAWRASRFDPVEALRYE